jgi:hypothetical protein
MQSAVLVISADEVSSDNGKAQQRQAMDGIGNSYSSDLLKSIRSVQNVQSKTRQQRQKKYITLFQSPMHHGCGSNGTI